MTAQTIDLPADLDLQVEEVPCDKCDKPAVCRVIVHGCEYGLGCAKCVADYRKEIALEFMFAWFHGRKKRCGRCYKLFDYVEDYFRAEPLKK